MTTEAEIRRRTAFSGFANGGPTSENEFWLKSKEVTIDGDQVNASINPSTIVIVESMDDFPDAVFAGLVF